MIQLIRPPIPQILANNQKKWTDELLDFIEPYGTYSNIPDNLKIQRDDLVNRYRHNEIKTALIYMSNDKCAFCEKYIEIGEIEHFFPKSLYPEYTFEWTNLFWVCKNCNLSKSAFDTYNFPIVHPVTDNPEDYFIYEGLQIEVAPHSPDFKKAERTIDVCGLWRTTLLKPRSSVLSQFHINQYSLRFFIEHYNRLTQEAARKRHANKILDFLKFIKERANKSEQHAGYLRFYLKKDRIIKQAIQLVNTQLNLNPPFQLDWK